MTIFSPSWQLNLSDNQLCGLDARGDGTYNAEGITAIADALCANASITRLDVRANLLRDEGKAALHKAIQARSGFALLL